MITENIRKQVKGGSGYRVRGDEERVITAEVGVKMSRKA